MEDRKGVLTPDQEKALDKLLVFNNKLAESVDGLAISLVDNQGIERLKQQLELKYPGASQEFLYPIVDAIMLGLESISNIEE